MTLSWPWVSRVVIAVSVAPGWCGVAGGVRADETRTIAWRSDLPAARSEAGATDRLVWVQFTGPWCHNCRRLESESFTHPRVVDHAASDFVPVKLRTDEHEELALGYGLSCLPATVILRPSGEVVNKVQGYLDPESYLSFLRSALSREGRSPAQTPSLVSASRATAMGGYCPVSLVDGHKLVAGRPELSLDDDGQVYTFATEAARDTFRAVPGRYVPVNGGRCPVAQVDRGESRPGVPAWGVLYQEHLYLCGDAGDRNRFLRHPERYAHVDVADRGFCPHCWAVDGLIVRGRSPYSLTRGGRRYLFPDTSHLEAYRSLDPSSRR